MTRIARVSETRITEKRYVLYLLLSSFHLSHPPPFLSLTLSIVLSSSLTTKHYSVHKLIDQHLPVQTSVGILFWLVVKMQILQIVQIQMLDQTFSYNKSNIALIHTNKKWLNVSIVNNSEEYKMTKQSIAVLQIISNGLCFSWGRTLLLVFLCACLLSSILWIFFKLAKSSRWLSTFEQVRFISCFCSTLFLLRNSYRAL